MRKWTIVAVASMVGIMIAGTAMGVYAEGNAVNTAVQKLSFEEAAEAALKDAGQTSDAVIFSKLMNEFDDGIAVYEIDFLIPGQTRYDYKINANSGAIMEKEMEPWEAEDDFEYKALLDETVNYFDFSSAEVSSVIDSSRTKALDEAAAAADETLFLYKTGMEYDDGRILYVEGFIIPDKTKFEFKFDASTGSLAQSERENWKGEYDFDYADLLKGAAAAAGAAADKGTEGQVTMESAEATALADAGFAESEVRMKRTEKDFDDGIERFEVEFFGPDGKEYSYEISVADGKILSREAEYDD